MDAEEFYAKAQEPEFGDEFLLILENKNPENTGTFSIEGIEGITDQIHDFLIARTFAQWKSTGKPPKKVAIGVSLMFESETPDLATVGPWYVGTDMGDTAIDAQHRMPRRRIDR